MNNDTYSQWDAAYVLGALSPADRRAYEEHLAVCAACQAAVSELAGMPGLLSQLSPEDAAALATDQPAAAYALPPVPAELLPRLLAHRRVGRRRPLLLAGAAAVVLLVFLGGVVAGSLRGPGDGSAVRRVAFAAVVPSAITAVVDVLPVADGTELRVECQYAEASGDDAGAHEEYGVYAVDRGGHAVPVKVWQAKPGKQMRPTGVTPWRGAELDSVEIREVDTGQVLLRAPLR